ncbi:acetolactate decarboxylase [Lactococcus garvieae]|uniref:acetolactate decarboxylase n=1 Tax=Lactococcus garvieae TaxID=1363 RepID=UPI00254ED96C|nr:acetolactate decarboxylase [Lactococcus garvieae]
MKLFQHNTLAALMSGLYEGTLTIGELLKKGDFGIGTLSGINGELIVLDGKAYIATGDKKVRQVEDSETVAYAAVAHHDATLSFQQEEKIASEELFEKIENEFNSENTFYTIKMTGDFDMMHVRMAPGAAEGEPFAKVAENQPEYKEHQVVGTIVGFWTPEMFHGVSVAGYHLHFLADSCNFGGHILGFTGFSGKVEIGQVDALEQNFPTKSQNFLQAKFNLDQLKKDIEQAE